MFTTKFPKFDRMLPNGSQIQPIVGRSDVGSNKFGEFSEFGKFHKLFFIEIYRLNKVEKVSPQMCQFCLKIKI